MKWIPLLSLPAMVLCPAQESDAGSLARSHRHQKATGCDCAPMLCCQPAIVRPCHHTIYCYQRQQACLKPACCDTCGAPGTSCGPEHFTPPRADTVYCDAPCCELPSYDECCSPDACRIDTCRLAELIFESQTACYPRQRRRAVHRLGNRYRCDCVPEVMDALVYALNDSDPFVRRTAADEIGDQLRKNPYCCCPRVVNSLTCALADCHRGTRRESEKALKRCGYEVIAGCRPGYCDISRFNFNGVGEEPFPINEDAMKDTPAPQEEEAPAPPEAAGPFGSAGSSTFLPVSLEITASAPAETSVYFRTKREFMESKARPNKGRTGLAGLFGLAK